VQRGQTISEAGLPPVRGKAQRKVELERKVGLARALSKLGYCSRSRAEKLIRGGQVRINGAVRTNPETPVHLGKDRLNIDGEQIQERNKIYLMLTNPAG
jgi:23S rRNA pseudouridine2605 synthase